MAAPRLSVSFDPRSAERLERLAGDDQGKADVIRDALALEDMYREATATGGRLLVQRPDGTVAEILRPSGPWGSTGRHSPDVIGGYTLPQGTNGDRDRRELLAQLVALLYSCTGSAQRASAQSETEHAVHQLVIANAALAASEAEAFLTLIACDLEGPACVHLRALGELTIRIVLSREHRDLALALYQSWAPSWERFVRKHISIAQFKNELDKSEKDMQALEKTPAFKQAKAEIIERDNLLNELEWAMWSKRAHGDIYALVQVSTNLATRGTDVRSPIVKEVPFGIMANVLLMRAIGFALVAAAHIVSEFRIDGPARILDECMKKYGAFQQRDEQARSATDFVKSVRFPYSYRARLADSQIFCDHNDHSIVENAAVCLAQNAGEVHELKDGVFTGTYWTYETKADGKTYSTEHTGSTFRGNTLTDTGD